jgi:hypothetical protein
MYTFLYYLYDSEAVTLTDEYVISLISRVTSLSKIQHQIFQLLGASENYYTVLSSYLSSKLSTDAQEIATALIQAEKAFTSISTDESKAEFKNIMESVSKSYDSLSDNDKAFLDAMYTKYMDEYNKLSTNE